MEDIVSTLGFMFCLFVVLEIIACFIKDKDFPNFILYPLTLIIYILMVGTAPIGLFVMWHDRRMEKTHIAAYREDRKPYEDSLNSSLTKLEQSNASLRKEITWYSNELRRYKDADHNVFFIRENKYLQEISDLKAEISRLNNMLSSEKELSYEKGFQEGERKGRLSAHTLAAKVMDSRIEKTRIESYQDGYKDGQADFPKGINILNEQ